MFLSNLLGNSSENTQHQAPSTYTEMDSVFRKKSFQKLIILIFLTCTPESVTRYYKIHQNKSMPAF